MPTVDVLERGKVYFELDAPFRVREPRFSSFVPRIVIGAGHNVEVGLNVTGNIQPGIDRLTLVPTIKWKVYNDEKRGLSFVVGDNFFIPVRQRTYRAGNYVYAACGKTFKTNTRLTFGAYHFTENVVAANAGRAGGQFGFEQALTKKITFQADWYTGKHANGYFTPGIAYKINSKVTGYFGYSLGNENLTHGNNFFYGELGINFN